MRRLLVLTILLLAAFAQTANAASPIVDLRPANATELQNMNQSLMTRYPATAFTLVTSSVSPTLGLGVVTARRDYRDWVAVFNVYPDGSVLLSSEASTPVSCSKTRELLIVDEVAEQLGMVEADSCSLGKPAQLANSQVAHLGRLRAAANRGISKFNKAVDRCKSYNCVGRVRDRHYKRPVSRLIGGAHRAQNLVSWGFCSPHLVDLEAAASAHRKALDELIFFGFIDSRSDVAKARRALKRAAKKSRTAWNGVKAECVKYAPN